MILMHFEVEKAEKRDRILLHWKSHKNQTQQKMH